MTTDDLSAPLGQDRPRRRRFQLPFTTAQALTALFGLFLVTFVGFAIFNNDPLGGEPIARVAFNLPSPSADKSAPPSTTAPQTRAPAGEAPKAPGQQTVTIIDGSSGNRQDVVIGGGPDSSANEDSSTLPADINPKLLEASRYGMIPTVAGSLKPFRAYAAGSDAERAKAAKTPSIAIVITGLGVGAAKTTEAILKLPGAVTLAFTPYGSDPAKLVTRARAQKHEVLLQVPMEPFDYPDNDPGPQTLLTSLGPEQNLDRLAWHMSRFQGYVGIANFMGSRLLASDAVMKPIIQEAGKRGLAYLDDGSVSRSVAGILADNINMPYAKADVSIDTLPTALDIDRSLARLETLARERGSAIGVASALPVSIERIGNWAKELEGRGIILVPLTTVMLKPKSS